MSTGASYKWNPEAVFEGEGGPFALLVLNSLISSPDKLIELWNKATFKVLVDGGASRWFQLCQDVELANRIVNPLPDLITGDLDSLDPDILHHYEVDHQIQVIRTPDQDLTDFTKAVFTLLESKDISKPDIDSILAYVEGATSSGRPDQIFANYETLFHVQQSTSSSPTFIISPRSIEWILPIGENRITIPKKTNQIQRFHCGLIPLGSCTNVTTSGFRWNVTNARLEFGILVSTSNEFDADWETATVNTPNHPLLFTLQMKPEI